MSALPDRTASPEPLEAPPDVALHSPSWPTRATTSAMLSAVLVACLSAPVVLAAPDAVVLGALALPLVGCGLLSRMIFELATPRPRTSTVTAAFAFAAALLGEAVAVAAGTVTLARPELGGALGATVGGAAVLLGAARLRGRERRRGRSLRRVFFIGPDQQYSDLRREVMRRGDLEIVGRMVPAAGVSRGAITTQIAAARPTTLVLSAESIRDEMYVGAAAEVHSEGLRVRALEDFYAAEFKKVPLADLTQAWFLFDVAALHKRTVSSVTKRVRESVLAAVLLVLLSPLMLIAAVAVRASGAGPILYRQPRVGLHGRSFVVTKFRTMRVAPAGHRQAWASTEALRITTAGRWLRRYRIDELPQLWSVVKGDLALVGPRPEQPEIARDLETAIEFYGARHGVRPGLTGWAQVNVGYGGSVDGTIEKLQYDFYYLRNQSLRLDLLIISATVRAILRGSG